MPVTLSYQAGTETGQCILSYAMETTWGVAPAVAFQQIRYTGESISGTKTRNRPGEILSTGEVAAAITTQETAGGGLNFALSFSTYDDFMSGALNADWGPTISANGVSGDISISAGAAGSVRTLTSTLAGKFAGVVAGQWVAVRGFTQPSANGFFMVQSATGTTLSYLNANVTTAETPTGSLVQVRGKTLVNGTTFKSMLIQKGFSPALFLNYPGTFVNGMTLSGATGQFLNGSFTLLSKNESSATVNLSTGSLLPPTSGKVHSPVSDFVGVFIDGLPLIGTVADFSVTTTDTGAAQEFGMGSASAQGMLMGLLDVKSALKIYFKDFSLYSRFRAETTGVVSFVTKDAAGSAYAVTLLSSTFQNARVLSGGPSQAVMAMFDIEGNPRAGGGTIQVDSMSIS